MQRFVADEMLGRLAKWLRLMGQDVKYFRHLDDSTLLRICLEEDRKLLTRDTLLMKRRPIARGQIQALLVSADDVVGQAREVVAWAGLERTEPRCPVCNGRLEAQDKADVEGEVPPYVLKTQAAFDRCEDCRRVYWKATHWERIEEQLASLSTGEK